MGLHHLDFLCGYLAFRDDIPSHDTLLDMLIANAPEMFEPCIADGNVGLRDTDIDIIAVDVDGKTCRGTHDREIRRHSVCSTIDWLVSDSRHPGEFQFTGRKLIGMVDSETTRNG